MREMLINHIERKIILALCSETLHVHTYLLKNKSVCIFSLNTFIVKEK